MVPFRTCHASLPASLPASLHAPCLPACALLLASACLPHRRLTCIPLCTPHSPRCRYFGGDPPTTPDEKHSATEEWYERLARVCMEVSEDAELHKPKSQGPTLKSIFKGVSSALHFSSHRSDETVHKSDLSEPLLE